MLLRLLSFRSLGAPAALGLCVGALAVFAPAPSRTAAFSGGQVPDCSFGGRACFDVRVELLLRPPYSTAGFHEPPAVRARALQREVYRQVFGGCAPERFARLTCFDADAGQDREDAARGRS